MSQENEAEAPTGRFGVPPRRIVLERARRRAMDLEDHYVELIAQDSQCLKRATALRTELDAQLAELSVTESAEQLLLGAQGTPEPLRAPEGALRQFDLTGQLSVDK